MMTVKLLGTTCVGACVVMVVAGCGESEVAPEPIRPVRAAQVGMEQTIPGRQFPGRANAKHGVELSFQVSGLLTSVPVDVGTKVKKGDVVGSLDPRDFQVALDTAQGNLARERANLLAMERGARPEEIEQMKATLEQAEATYREAVAEHERKAKLQTKGGASKEEVEESLARKERNAAQIKIEQENLRIGLAGARPEDLEAQRAEIRALEAAVADAKNQLDYSVLTAPFDGEVVARYVDNYQTVQAKQQIVRLVDISKIEVTIQVPESLISLAPQVKKVICRFDAFEGREFECQVTKIGNEASQITRTYPVTVQLEQPGDVLILPGMAGTVQGLFDIDRGVEGLVVPASAVFAAEDSQKSLVWVADEDSKKVSLRNVTIRQPIAAGLVVADGVKAGEWVVTAGVHSLREGQQVKLLPTEGLSMSREYVLREDQQVMLLPTESINAP
jgi:RND family efflux transporter MFP subunit